MVLRPSNPLKQYTEHARRIKVVLDKGEAGLIALSEKLFVA